MNEYKLYRGISVSPEAADAVIGRILEDGITGSEGKRTATLGDLQEARGTIEMSFKERKFDYRNYLDDESNDKAIYAAGTRYGASYYACKHNAPKKEESEALVIEFTVSEDDLAVDLNDFLCTTFQMARSTPEAIRPEQEQCLRSVFGDDILRYFRASCESEDTETQVALAYLAAIDTNIIRAHYKNASSAETVGKFPS